MEQTKRKASTVTAQASAVISGGKSIAQAAERQLEALSKANDMVPGVTAATEEALAALRCVCFLLSPRSWDENRRDCAHSLVVVFSLLQLRSTTTYASIWSLSTVVHCSKLYMQGCCEPQNVAYTYLNLLLCRNFGVSKHLPLYCPLQLYWVVVGIVIDFPIVVAMLPSIAVRSRSLLQQLAQKKQRRRTLATPLPR